MLKVGSKLRPAPPARLFGYAAVAVVVLISFFWRLGDLTPGLSPSEAAARSQSSSLHNLLNNAVNGPHQLLQHFIFKGGHSHFSLRLSSALAACLLAFCFYKLATKWFGRLIGLFSSLIFLFFPLFIVSGRQASAEIMLFSPIVLLWLYAWLSQSQKRLWLPGLCLILGAGLLIYTPGLIYWLLAGAIICHKKLIETAKKLPLWQLSVGLVILAGLMVPLIVDCVYHPAVGRQLLLVPAHWQSLVQILKNLGWMGLSLVWRAPAHTPLIIDRLPLLNVIVVVLVIFGVYALGLAARVKLGWLAGAVLFAILAAGINDQLDYLALGLPAIGLLASAGLRYLYIEWRSIFPLNPVPKTFALLLIALVSASQIYFGGRYALVAWPHSPPIHSLYMLK